MRELRYMVQFTGHFIAFTVVFGGGIVVACGLGWMTVKAGQYVGSFL